MAGFLGIPRKRKFLESVEHIDVKVSMNTHCYQNSLKLSHHGDRRHHLMFDTCKYHMKWHNIESIVLIGDDCHRPPMRHHIAKFVPFFHSTLHGGLLN